MPSADDDLLCPPVTGPGREQAGNQRNVWHEAFALYAENWRRRRSDFSFAHGIRPTCRNPTVLGELGKTTGEQLR